MPVYPGARTSRFSRMKIPHMHRFSDLAGSASDSRITPPAMLPSACHDDVGTPIHPISRLNSWPVRTPIQRFAAPSRVANAWLGATVDRYSFGVGLFHPHLHAGLSRRFPRLPDPHLTRHACLFRIAHHDRVTAFAACGGLKPPPAGRLRRASNPSSPAQHRFSKLYLHRTPFHVKDTREPKF